MEYLGEVANRARSRASPCRIKINNIMFKTNLTQKDLKIDKMAIRLAEGQKAGYVSDAKVSGGVVHESFRGYRIPGSAALGFSDEEVDLTRKKKKLDLRHVNVKSNTVDRNVIAHATRGMRKQEKQELAQQKYAVNWNPIREAMGKATAGEETQGGEDGMRQPKNMDQLNAAPLRVRDYVYKETDHGRAQSVSLRT